jgi:hypothetical protein
MTSKQLDKEEKEGRIQSTHYIMSYVGDSGISKIICEKLTSSLDTRKRVDMA